jgi:hypothetical protein
MMRNHDNKWELLLIHTLTPQAFNFPLDRRIDSTRWYKIYRYRHDYLNRFGLSGSSNDDVDLRDHKLGSVISPCKLDLSSKRQG